MDRLWLSRTFLLHDQQGSICFCCAIRRPGLLFHLRGRFSSSIAFRLATGRGGMGRRGARGLRGDYISIDWRGDGPPLSRDANVWRHAVPGDNFYVRNASIDGGPVPRWILVIPVVWSLIGGSAAILLKVPQDWLLLIGGCIALTLIIFETDRRCKSRRNPRPRRMVAAKRYPSIAFHGSDGFRTANPTYWQQDRPSDLPVGQFVERAVDTSLQKYFA